MHFVILTMYAFNATSTRKWENLQLDFIWSLDALLLFYTAVVPHEAYKSVDNNLQQFNLTVCVSCVCYLSVWKTHYLSDPPSCSVVGFERGFLTPFHTMNYHVTKCLIQWCLSKYYYIYKIRKG